MEHGSPYDDDCDGKLVIAEHDDLDDDLKPDELGMLGGLLGKDGKKPRRKHSRFNGLPEDEVMKRLLPDLICPNLDILIVSNFLNSDVFFELFKYLCLILKRRGRNTIKGKCQCRLILLIN